MGSGVTTSGQRIRARYVAGADGSKEFRGWFDSQRNEECFFKTAADNMTRCMPDGAFQGGYKDAGCTIPLAYVPKGSCATTPPPKYAMIPAAGNMPGCGGGYDLFLIGAKLGAQSVYTGSPASCSELPAASWTPMFDAYEIGAAVPATDFVAGNLMTE